MQKPFEEYGFWWSPGHEILGAQSFHGKLSWNPAVGAMLEAVGLNKETSDAFGALMGKVIPMKGRLDNMECISLEDAMIVRHSPYSFGPGKVSISCFKFLKGTLFEGPLRKLPLRRMSCEITDLASWVNEKSFHVDRKNPKRATVNCLPYTEQLFAVVDGIEIWIALWNRDSESGQRFSTESVSSIELKSTNLRSLEDGKLLLDELKAFLTLALDRPVVYEAIRAEVEICDEVDNRKVSREVEYFEIVDDHTLNLSKWQRSDNRIPFLFRPIERSAAAYLAFREIYKKCRMALDFFFSYTYGSQSYVSQQFADMVHGLEGLHRWLRGGTFINQKSYDEEILPALVGGIPEGIDKQLRQALKKRLEFGNEYSLRRRLKEIARFHNEYAGPSIGKPTVFADEVADMRNRLAHATGTDHADDLQVTRYHVMLHRVRLLFQLELFHHLGFDESFLRGCAERLESSALASQQIS